jgi:hypothetical protein
LPIQKSKILPITQTIKNNSKLQSVNGGRLITLLITLFFQNVCSGRLALPV